MQIVNYLILVHDKPKQLLRIIKRLDAEWVKFYIHVDARSNINSFFEEIPADDHIHYISDRQACYWGDLSLVDAVLAGYREIVKEGNEGFCVLLSGQDYPLRTPEYIKNFFEQHANENFISVYPIPDPKKKSENGGEERLISYTFNCLNPKNARMKAKIQPLSLRLKTLGGFVRLAMYRRDLLPFAFKAYFRKRKYPEGLAKCFNEMWVALNDQTVKWLLNTIDCHPEYREYYRYTHIPDETMFGAILMGDETMKKSIRPMCHYIRWDGGQFGSPKTLSMDDVNDIEIAMQENEGILFARKFEQDSEILNCIDKRMLS